MHDNQLHDDRNRRRNISKDSRVEREKYRHRNTMLGNKEVSISVVRKETFIKYEFRVLVPRRNICSNEAETD